MGYTPRVLGELNQVEKRWVDALKRSYLDLTVPFNAKQAVEAIHATPSKQGIPFKNVPNSYKMAYVLRKAPGIRFSHRDAKKRPYYVLA